MTSHEQPTGLALTFRHDGALLLELLHGWYDAFDSVLTRVDDGDRIRAVLRWWIARTPTSTERRSTFPAWQEFASDRALRMLITEQPSAAARKLAFGSDSASSGFAKTLATGPTDPTSRASQSFIDDVARGALRVFRTEQQRAEKRLAGGKYLPILEGYLEEMRSYVAVSDQYGAYHDVRAGIGAILDDEEYLTLSPEPRARSLYSSLLAEQSNLYQWYMDLAKGGHERGRERR